MLGQTEGTYDTPIGAGCYEILPVSSEPDEHVFDNPIYADAEPIVISQKELNEMVSMHMTQKPHYKT